MPFVKTVLVFLVASDENMTSAFMDLKPTGDNGLDAEALKQHRSHIDAPCNRNDNLMKMPDRPCQRGGNASTI